MGHGDYGEAWCCGGGGEGNLVEGGVAGWLSMKAAWGWGRWSVEGWRHRTAARETGWQ